MNIDDFNNDMMSSLEKIMSTAELKQGLKSLKEFKIACLDGGFNQAETDDIIRFISLILFTTHFKVKLGE